MIASSGFSMVVSDVCVDRGGTRVLDAINLTVHADSRIGLIGPNGVGKSTLLSVLSQELSPTSGSLTLAPPNATVGLIRQEREASTIETVLQTLRRRTGVQEARNRFDAAIAAVARSEPGCDTTYTHALDVWMNTGAGDFDARVGEVLDDLGLAQEVLRRPTGTLSGGQLARVELASILASNFVCTLLDEPTNDLDREGLDRLERWAAECQGGLIVVSHDRAFLESVVDSVFELDAHTRTGTLFRGGWTSYREQTSTKQRHEQERFSQHRAKANRLAARAQQQREWTQQGASAARKRPADGDKHRVRAAIAQTEKLAGKAAATERALDRLESVEKPFEGWDLQFSIASAGRSGSDVVRIDDGVFRRGAFSLGPLHLSIQWGERVALAGPNGSGKSTLLAAVLGRLHPTAGRVSLGPSVVVGDLDQGRHHLVHSERSLLDVFCDRSGLVGAEARSLLAKFGLDRTMVERQARQLSPGERTRAQLAEFQARGINLLVLDEPTNHLDLVAIAQLERALETFEGTLVVVSHDRRFVESVDLSRTIDMTAFPTAISSR